MRTGRTAHLIGVISAAIAVVASAADGARAGPSSGCAAANSGSFNATLSSGSVTREIALDAGDIVNVSVQAAHGANASVTLIGGAGAPRTLIERSASGSTSFRATATQGYTLSFAGEGAAVVSVTCAPAKVSAANAAFLARRRDLLNAQGPDRIRIDRAPSAILMPDQPLPTAVVVDEQGNAREVQFSVSLSEIAAAGGKPQPALVDLWVEGRMEKYGVSDLAEGSRNGNLGVLYLGTRSMIGSDLLVGALAQLDRGIESSRYGPSQMAATGWLAGPYMSMRLGPGVVFDGRAAWGTTENVIPGEVLSDGEAERRLVRAKLTGTREVEGWKVAPSVGLSFVEDATRDPATGDAMAAGTGRVEVLPEVSRRFDVNDTTFVEPRAAVGGFLGFEDFNKLNSVVMSDAAPDLHLKAEAGVAVGVKDGTTLQATGGVESGTAAIPENWTGRLQFNVPLSK